MKRNILILFAASLVIWSCGKRQEENEAFTSSAEDQAMAEGLWDDIGEQADGSTETVEEGESSWNNCATLTIDTAGNPFPLSVTVDFGDGCEGRDGRIRKGRLHYTLTNWMRFEGGSHLCTPDAWIMALGTAMIKLLSPYGIKNARSTCDVRIKPDRRRPEA